MHWCLHFAQALQAHGQLPACWTMERKHKDIRKHGNVLCNTQQWETSLMKTVTAEHMYRLGENSNLFARATCLDTVRAPTKKMLAGLHKCGVLPPSASCMCSTSCKLASGATILCGDVVLLHTLQVVGNLPSFAAAQVHSFLQLPIGDVALVEKYEFKDYAPPHYVSKWAVPSPRDLCLVSLEEIICAVTFSAAKGNVTCLTPAFLQC